MRSRVVVPDPSWALLTWLMLPIVPAIVAMVLLLSGQPVERIARTVAGLVFAAVSKRWSWSRSRSSVFRARISAFTTRSRALMSRTMSRAFGAHAGGFA